MASITCGNCKGTHSNVNEVRACYGKPAVHTPLSAALGDTTGDRKAEQSAVSESLRGLAEAFPAKAIGPKGTFGQPATEKQVAYIASLRDSRGLEPLAFAGTKAQASTEIERLMSLPKAKATTKASSSPVEEPADGIYVDRTDDGDVIYKVYKMVHGSGRQGVKRLAIEFADGEKASGRFVYVGLAAKHLPATAQQMSLEEAKEFGSIYGFCVRCAATLTDDESIAAGIGPICASKM